jgi:hypothetical protein
MKGFSSQWCDWIDTIIQGGACGIKINNQVGPNFQTKKGLHRGDPLSPLIFNIVVDMLAILIKRAKLAGQIGMVPHLVDDGWYILQYTDDTIIFMENDLEKAKNLKILLYAFKKLSGLKINFHKSEMYCFGEARGLQDEYSTVFGCQSASFPFKYLDIPMHFRKLSNKDWKVVEEMVEKRLSSWKGKYLCVGG